MMSFVALMLTRATNS